MYNQFIERLKTVASRSEFTKYRVGAIVFSNKQDVLSEGYNKRKTHPRQASLAKLCGCADKQFLHAEIDALIKCRAGRPHSILIGRITKNNNFSLARPCDICMRAINDSGIQEIIYTNRRGEFTYERL